MRYLAAFSQLQTDSFRRHAVSRTASALVLTVVASAALTGTAVGAPRTRSGPDAEPVTGYSAPGAPVASVTNAAGSRVAVKTPYVSRGTILTRAKSWYKARVPYSQSVRRAGYRTDCSGYVSMTWGLGYYLNTQSLGQASITHRIAKSSLRPGDILLNTTGSNFTRHVVLFEGWANAKHTRYLAYEQSGPRYSPTKHHVIAYPYPYRPQLYVPRRYNRVLESADINGDGYGDVLARNRSGKLYRYLTIPGRNTFRDRIVLKGSWAGYNALIAADVNGDGFTDVLARTSSGRLYRYLNLPGRNRFGGRSLVSTGWRGYSKLVGADLNGDGHTDLLARDRSGRLYGMLNRPGHNSFAKRAAIGPGWNRYVNLVPVDLNGDGRTDLLARDRSGHLYRYLNRRGHNDFGLRVLIASGWSHLTPLAGTDLNGDHFTDLLARDSSGHLYRYLNRPGHNRFGPRALIGAGWNMYPALT